MKKQRVLIWDLETNGVSGFKADLGFVACFGYKWLGEKATHCLRFDQHDGYTENGYSDKGLLIEAMQVMEQADLLVAHYGDYFDRKFFQGRLLINGLGPMPPVKQIDTCRLSWKYFKFGSNRLKMLAKTLGCGEQKDINDFPGWWLRVLRGDTNALRLMAKYCKQDVRTLEEIYLKMRAFDENQHPRLVADRSLCRLCGSDVEYRGYHYSPENKYRRYVCTNIECRKWDRERRALPKLNHI